MSLRDMLEKHRLAIYGEAPRVARASEAPPIVETPPSVDTRPGPYYAAFLAEHDPYRCPRCGEAVLLEVTPKGKRYTNWYDGRPHWQECGGTAR